MVIFSLCALVPSSVKRPLHVTGSGRHRPAFWGCLQTDLHFKTLGNDCGGSMVSFFTYTLAEYRDYALALLRKLCNFTGGEKSTDWLHPEPSGYTYLLCTHQTIGGGWWVWCSLHEFHIVSSSFFLCESNAAPDSDPGKLEPNSGIGQCVLMEILICPPPFFF